MKITYNEEINKKSHLEDFIRNNRGVMVYFSTPTCSVCKVLKPKIINLLKDKYTKIKFVYINTESSIELTAQTNVFSVPTILFYVNGKEFLRKSRFINLNELDIQLERIYSFISE